MLAILCLWHRSQTYMLYIYLYIYTFVLNLYVGSIYVYGILWQSAKKTPIFTKPSQATPVPCCWRSPEMETSKSSVEYRQDGAPVR
jgi:hypothetical protein